MDLSLIPKVDRVILALEDEDYNSLLLAESAKEGIDRLRHAMLEGQFAQADKEELFELACSFTREIYTDKTTFSLRPVSMPPAYRYILISAALLWQQRRSIPWRQ